MHKCGKCKIRQQQMKRRRTISPWAMPHTCMKFYQTLIVTFEDILFTKMITHVEGQDRHTHTHTHAMVSHNQP